MRRTLTTTVTTLGLAAALAGGLAACGGGSGGDGLYGGGDPTTDSGTTSEDAGSADAGAAGAALTTADSSLGTIVVDGEGMTVYYYDQDTPGSGESACEGECAAAWPAVPAGGEDPQVDGVTAEVGTITGVDGELQLTLDGRPLYTYAGDAGPGDVAGQGVNDVWWVVAPDGTEVMDAATSSGAGY